MDTSERLLGSSTPLQPGAFAAPSDQALQGTLASSVVAHIRHVEPAFDNALALGFTVPSWMVQHRRAVDKLMGHFSRDYHIVERGRHGNNGKVGPWLKQRGHRLEEPSRTRLIAKCIFEWL